MSSLQDNTILGEVIQCSYSEMTKKKTHIVFGNYIRWLSILVLLHDLIISSNIVDLQHNTCTSISIAMYV